MSSPLPAESSADPLNPSEPPSLRWGLLACAQVTRRFAADLQADGHRILAIASRSLEKARSFAAAFNLPKAYGAYEDLLADPDIDVIYIALPNSLHAEWSIKALEAGKHVLCEKPAALHAEEMDGILAAAGRANRFFMEGFAFRCHPYYQALAAAVSDQKVGEVRLAQVTFAFDMGYKPQDIRQRLELGGGALSDVGCYCLSFLIGLFGEPREARALQHRGLQTGVDEAASGSILFASGALATFNCAIRIGAPHGAILYGTQGRIEVPSPWHPHREKAGFKVIRNGREEWRAFPDALSLFGREARAVEEAVRANRLQSPWSGWEDSRRVARVLENLRQSP